MWSRYCHSRWIRAAHFPFGDQFEPGSMQIIGVPAPFRYRGLIEQELPHTLPDTNGALISPKPMLNSTGIRSPVRVRGKAKEHCDLR